MNSRFLPSSPVWTILIGSTMAIIHMSLFHLRLESARVGPWVGIEDAYLFATPLISFFISTYFGMKAREFVAPDAAVALLAYTLLFFAIIQPSRDFSLMNPTLSIIAVVMLSSLFAYIGGWIGHQFPSISETPPHS